MKRAALLLLCVCGLVAWGLATGAGDDGSSDAPRYSAEIDNAFGLIEGGDLKVAGVRAGKITGLDLDRQTRRAVVDFEITETGFGSLRADVRCEARPQSLIGEYFLDCLPGTSDRELPPGTRIPVSRTTSTIPPDLVNNILRRPYRERLALILGELGAGVGGNGENLNAALRRAVPALRETDEVLARLARQDRVLADLVRDADTVVSRLADKREDVGRFVTETRDTARASAERSDEISEGFRRLPGFLGELRPAMRSLGEVADAQIPALRNLRASATGLDRLLRNLGPFAEASRPAVRSLGEASVTGRQAVRAAGSTVAELGRFTRDAPEVSNNLRFVLEHLGDRSKGVEADPRSPGGKGYTGFEALLTYVYDQVLSTNIYDQNAHILNVAPIPPTDACAMYADPERAKDPETKDCVSALGPNQPGLNFPDPSAGPEAPAETRRKGSGRAPAPAEDVPAHALPSPSQPAPADEKPAAPAPDRRPLLPGLPEVVVPLLPGLPDLEIGSGRNGRLLPSLGDSAQRDASRTALLDYLLGR